MLPTELTKAKNHLRKACPLLAEVIKQVGPCTMTFNPDTFSVLCRSIVNQQLSTKAAAAIGAKVLKLIGGKYAPKKFDQATDDELRSCGLSFGKISFLRDLAAKVKSGEVPVKKLPNMADDDIRDCLIAVKGIGPWTVDMFLMFGLGRPDIFPVGDLAIRQAVKKLFKLEDDPTQKETVPFGEHWKPYRSIASWYLWRSLDVK